MKNFLLILFGLIVLLVLFLLMREDDKMPHVILAQDTTVIGRGNIEGGNAKILESADPSSLREEVKAEFLGKTFPKCMSIIYKIPNSYIEEMENNAESISFINAWVKGTHHMLYFQNGICVQDEILKD